MLILDRLQVVQFGELPQHRGLQQQLAVVAPLIFPIRGAQPFGQQAPTQVHRHGRSLARRAFGLRDGHQQAPPFPAADPFTDHRSTANRAVPGQRPVEHHRQLEPHRLAALTATRMRTFDRASFRRSLRRGLVHASGSTGSNCSRRSAP